MSMWDWDEQGEEDRQQYRDPYASHSGSSNSRGGQQQHGNHAHHHHVHVGHGHQHEHDDGYGHSHGGSTPPRQNYGGSNYGARHESYEDQDDSNNYGQHGYGEGGGGHGHNAYAQSTYSSSNMARAPAAAHATRYGGHDVSAGYEEHHAPPPSSGHGHGGGGGGHGHEPTGRTDLFTSDAVVNLTLDEIDALARTHRSRSWLVVLYAPWCRFCQVYTPTLLRCILCFNNLEMLSLSWFQILLSEPAKICCL